LYCPNIACILGGAVTRHPVATHGLNHRAWHVAQLIQRKPVSARAITMRWISLVPS
jgi:hypothetical protein